MSEQAFVKSILTWLKKFEREEIVLFLIILLSIIGVAMTEYSPEASWFYWIAMVVVFGFSAGFIEHHAQTDLSLKLGELILKQFLHWGATLVAILLSFAFVKTGRMTDEAAGLVILLILALSAFLNGRQGGWRFYVIGVFLAATAVLTAYMEEFLWMLVVIAVICMGASVYLGKYIKAVKHSAISP
jgi:aminopeptidase-like protein